MFEILLTITIMSSSANGGSAVAIAKIGKYDDAATCEQISNKLNEVKSLGWHTKVTTAQCVQIINTPQKATK